MDPHRYATKCILLHLAISLDDASFLEVHNLPVHIEALSGFETDSRRT